MKIQVLMTGGTIAQQVDAHGRMEIARSVDELVASIRSDALLSTHSFGARTGANLTYKTALDICNHVIEHEHKFDGFVLITGTDSMEELAFFLDCTLRISKPLVLTGAMKPSDIVGYDGIANLEQAVQVASNPSSQGRGVLLAINDSIHLARYVRKQDTQHIGAFASHPGPVGQVRRGEIYYYYNNDHSDDYFDVSGMQDIEVDVQILLFSFGQRLPREILPTCDGLVIAGMGTSSISDVWIEELSDGWTSKIPIVLVSRCWKGTNYDDSYYRGSLDKYEERGFRLREYVHLNPLQARIKLILQLTLQ